MNITIPASMSRITNESFEGITQALNPALVQTELSRLPFFQSAHLAPELTAIRLSRYKPGRRCLIEYDLLIKHASQAAQPLTLMAKIRMKSHDHKTWRLLNDLWKGGMNSQAKDGVVVPEPIGEIPHWHMLLQRKVPGLALESLLAGPRGEELAKRVAEAATKIHCSGISTNRRHDIVDELNILNQRLTVTAQTYPQWSERIKCLFHQCEALGHSLPPAMLCGIHRDFYADQIIVDDATLYLLDFDLYCVGDPALDIGNFIAHITEFSVRTLGDATALIHVEQALTQRYVQLNAHISVQTINAYATLTLARHIHISTLFPERMPFTEALLEFTEKRLSLW